MSFIWLSDLHTKPAHSYRKTLLSGDAFFALDQIQSWALSSTANSVILGGDVYDSNQPQGESINRMAEFIAALKARGITVYYIEGNHDRVNRNPYLPKKYYNEHRLLSSIGAVPLGRQEIDGLVFQGIDYCPTDKLHQQLETLEECDVLCLHAGFRHLLGFEDAYDLTKEDIPKTVLQAVLVGHIHTADSHQTEGGVAIHSSGSTWVWRVDEAERKHGFLHFDGDLRNPMYVELECRKYYDIDDVQDILMTMAEPHALPPVLRYDRNVLTSLDHEQYGDAVKLIAMSGDAAIEEMLDANEEHAADLMDALIIGVPKEQYPAQFAFMKELLDSQTPVEFMTGWLAQQKVTLKQGA